MPLEHDMELPSPDERRMHGRAKREATPRSSLAYLANRMSGFDAVQVLEDQGVDRLASYLPLRHQRMA